MRIDQKIEQPVDVASWFREEEVYPEGKRVKTLVYCPSIPPYEFLESGRHLFKLSPGWAPEQFWVEIFAYHLGVQMQINVPPAFVAFDSQRNNLCGALIEWFLSSGKDRREEYIRGGVE